jgi:hypothetical protein
MPRTRKTFQLIILTALVLAACQPSTPISPTPVSEGPRMGGFLMPHGADGEGWPPYAEVTIQVYDRPQGTVLSTRKSQAGGDGHFYQDVDVTTQPGMVVAVTGGKVTRLVTLVPLTIESIDPAGDTVSGSAPQGAEVILNLGDNGQSTVLRTVTSEAGLWKADFSNQFDITETTVVQATVRDTNGNGTVYKTRLK